MAERRLELRQKALDLSILIMAFGPPHGWTSTERGQHISNDALPLKHSLTFRRTR
jgi:hypothetical protein